MAIAALIISVLSLVASLACLVLMLAKNFFSSHVVQLQPLDPFAGSMGAAPSVDPLESFREFDNKPLDKDEEEYFKKQNLV